MAGYATVEDSVFAPQAPMCWMQENKAYFPSQSRAVCQHHRVAIARESCNFDYKVPENALFVFS